MAETVTQFLNLLQSNGSTFVYHRSANTVPCPCRTPQGYRDDLWHKTDKPQVGLVTPSAGALTGHFQYMLANVYAQGEKYTDDNLIVPPVNLLLQRVTLDWVPAKLNPPSGRGPAISYRVYRMNLDVVDAPWKLAGEIPVGTNTFIDNSLDAALPDGEPILMLCNAAGYIDDPSLGGDFTEFSAKGFIQPIQSGAVRRLPSEEIREMFGDVQADDHLGILPLAWSGHILDFDRWRENTEDWLSYPSAYHDRKFTVVSSNMIPDPASGLPHHWEVGMRLVGLD